MKIKVRCIEEDIIFESIEEAEYETGTCRSSISACCRGIYKTAGGYTWEYVKE